MGIIKTFTGRSDEAIDFFNRARRLDPHHSSGYLYYLGLAKYCLKRYDDAAVTLEKSLRLNPKYGPWPLAITYAQLNRGVEAANLLAEYFERRKWQVVFIENTFRYWPFMDQDDLDHWAEGLRKSGLMRPWNPVYRKDYDAAFINAKQLLNDNAEDALSQYTMGETLVYSGRSDEALEYIERAIRLDPNHPGYYLFMLGVAQFCQERYNEAAASLERCLYKKKMHVNPPMWLLAATYAYMDREEDAKEVLTLYMDKNGFENFTVERVLRYYLHAFKNPGDTERFAQGLIKAGLPKQ